MIDVNQYLGAKWVEGGRVWPEIDCYGIVLKVREDLGLPQWPAWDGVTKRNHGLHREGTSFARSVTRCEPEEGAVAACYEGGLMTHVGIVINTPAGLEVIECNPRTRVTCMPLRRFVRRFIRVEFYK